MHAGRGCAQPPSRSDIEVSSPPFLTPLAPLPHPFPSPSPPSPSSSPLPHPFQSFHPRPPGLFDAGFTVVALDDGMVEVNRDANGNLVPDPTGFPNGFAELGAWLNSQGMTFGAYTDRGDQTCGGRAGIHNHEVQDAAFYVANNFGYLKVDSCGATQDHQTAFAEYAAVRDALNGTGKPVTFSLCGWNPWYAPVGHALGNSWRIGPDDTNWNGILADSEIMLSDGVAQYAGPGGWNDPCLLLGRDVNGDAAITDAQGRAQFTLWALFSAPMLLSQDIRNLTAMQLETYLNREVIGIGQDVIGTQAIKLAGGPLQIVPRVPGKNERDGVKTQKRGADRYSVDMHPWGSPLRPTTTDSNTPITVQPCATSAHTGLAVTPQTFIFNTPQPGYLANPATNMCWNVDDCGAEVIAFACVTTGGTCCGADCYDTMTWQLSPNGDGTIRSTSQPDNCVTSTGPDSQISLQACVPGLASQQWTYDNTTQSVRDKSGDSCLTVGGNLTRTAVFGKQLSDGSWAVGFLNAGIVDADLPCGGDCLAPTGWEPTQALMVRDVWNNVFLPNTTAAAGVNVTALPADGGIALLKLIPYWGSTPTPPREL
jgi:hypothetical protein